MQAVLDITRIALSMLFLCYASWNDYKTREVSNNVWILFAPPAFALTFIGLFMYDPSQLLFYGLSFGLTTAFAIMLFYAGGFGGADAKALMCLALALPFYPSKLLAPLSGVTSPISEMFFPLTIFSNAVILVIAPIVGIALRNIYWRSTTGKKLFEGDLEKEHLGKKILVFTTGYKVSIKKLKEKWHVYPLEDTKGDRDNGSGRKLIVWSKDEGRESIVQRLEKEISSGTIEDSIWASPGLPMLILITLGLVTALFFGDIVWTLVTALLA